MANTETQAAGAAAAEAVEGGLLDQILTQSKIARSDTERTRARDLIAELVAQVSDGALTVSNDAITAIDARIAEIDRVLSEQLSAVMHAPEFQQLEGSWRGLKYLVDNSETSTNLKIKVLNTTKKELLKDFKSASDFDQSALFKKLYEEEYGTFGGAPFATLIGDFEFGRHPEDMYLVEEISHVCAAAHAPFLSAASPELLTATGCRRCSPARATSPRSSTPWNTRSGRASAPPRIRATSGWPCRTCSVACRTARTPRRSRRSTSSRPPPAPTTTSTCG